MAGMFSKTEETTRTSSTSDTIIGSTIHIEGALTSEEDVVIAGSITGSIKTSKNIHIQAGAHIEADITAHDVLISGEITGNIRSTGTVTLTQTGRVTGDISAAHIAIENGAQLKGQISTEPNK